MVFTLVFCVHGNDGEGDDDDSGDEGEEDEDDDEEEEENDDGQAWKNARTSMHKSFWG